MPKLTNSLPKCRLHKRSGLAVVTLTGHDFYLGPYGTKASKLEYDRLIGAWLAAIRQKLWGFHVRERDVLRGWLSPSILCGARALRSSRCGLAGVEAHKGAGRTILRLDQPVIVRLACRSVSRLQCLLSGQPGHAGAYRWKCYSCGEWPLDSWWQA